MSIENMCMELFNPAGSCNIRTSLDFGINRYNGVTILSMPTKKRLNGQGGTKTTYSFMQVTNRFEILPKESKDKLKFHINKTYKKAILSGSGIEISDIILKLYHDNEILESKTLETDYLVH